jgi:hypothetical protein
MIMEHKWNATGKAIPKYSEITVPVALHLPQIPHGTNQDLRGKKQETEQLAIAKEASALVT